MAMQSKSISPYILEEHNLTDPYCPRLLVTGTSGHLGHPVAELLLSAGVPSVSAASRHPDKICDLAARGAPLRRADFDDPVSLDEAFVGVDRQLLISIDALGTPGQRQHKTDVDASVRAGVKHIECVNSIFDPTSSLFP